WAAIAATFATRYFAPKPYRGATSDVEGMTFVYGHTGGVTITPEIVANSPEWLPSEPDPPISAKRALAIADRYRQAHLRDKHNWAWNLEQIALVPLDGQNNKWCWTVHFNAMPVSGGLNGGVPTCEIFVLMNGDVVENESQLDDASQQMGILEKP